MSSELDRLADEALRVMASYEDSWEAETYDLRRALEHYRKLPTYEDGVRDMCAAALKALQTKDDGVPSAYHRIRFAMEKLGVPKDTPSPPPGPLASSEPAVATMPDEKKEVR